MLPALPVAAMDAEAAKARMSARMNRPVRVRLRDDRVRLGLKSSVNSRDNFSHSDVPICFPDFCAKHANLLSFFVRNENYLNSESP